METEGQVEAQIVDERELLQESRQFLQSIVDKYLPEGKRFSVSDFSPQEIQTFIDLIRGDVTTEELTERYEKAKREFTESYENLVAFTQYYGEQRNCLSDTSSNLNALKEDITLDQGMNNLDFDLA